MTRASTTVTQGVDELVILSAAFYPPGKKAGWPR
jgi:hypothetical protein